MKIDELIQRRIAMEKEVAREVGVILHRFKMETGLSPYSISIDMEEVTCLGDTERQYGISGCAVNIKI